jgi:alpha-beta hydrolase superfamily lysophospholipase
MAHSEISFTSSWGQPVFGNKWIPDSGDKIIGNLIIIHGMAEYSCRYNDFAQYLANTVGINVYGVDHIGHGLAVSKQPDTFYKYGMWPKDGFQNSVNQVAELVKFINKENNLPIVVFGHSLGSFLCQAFYEQHSDEVKAVVLCGSAYNNATYKMSRCLTAIMNVFKPKKSKDKVSKLLVNASGKTLNKKQKPFADGYTSEIKQVNWLSYNEDNVKKYDADNECGFPCDFNFYYSMFKGQQIAWKKKALEQIKKPKDMLIIAGQDDPVGNYGKDVEHLANFFLSHQQNVRMKLYPHKKHEIHNEDGKEEVYKDVAEFVGNELKK